MSCNGLVCFPEPDWIIVLNPSTGQILRFPSGPDPISSQLRNGTGLAHFLGNWVLGFGRDQVTGSYKVVKMWFEPTHKECNVLYVESGEWKKLGLPPYVNSVGRESVCVNGSIYWLFTGLLHIGSGYHLLALDLHKEEFYKVSVPDTLVEQETQIVNLEDRLAIANARKVGPDRILEIYSTNAEEETWSKTYSISLASLEFKLPESMWCMLFTPVAVSKQENLVFCNDDKRLFKYYSETDEIRCLSLDMCVISPYLENLAPLGSESGRHNHPGFKVRISRCRLFAQHPGPDSEISKFLKWIRIWVVTYIWSNKTKMIVFYLLYKILTTDSNITAAALGAALAAILIFGAIATLISSIIRRFILFFRIRFT